MEMEPRKFNDYWTDIYYHLHYPHKEKVTHQVIRILQHVQKEESVGINELANYLNVSQNTASDHIKRIITKGLLIKKRDSFDERKVILCLTDEGKEVVYRNTSLDEGKLDNILQSFNDGEKKMIINAFKLLSERAKRCM